jgi:hypothetical protein
LVKAFSRHVSRFELGEPKRAINNVFRGSNAFPSRCTDATMRDTHEYQHLPKRFFKRVLLWKALFSRLRLINAGQEAWKSGKSSVDASFRACRRRFGRGCDRYSHHFRWIAIGTEYSRLTTGPNRSMAIMTS